VGQIAFRGLFKNAKTVKLSSAQFASLNVQMGARMRATTLRFYKERILRVLVEIQRRLDEPLPLVELARLAGLSPHHFHHVFTGMLGEPLKAHIRRLRLERAAGRLKLSRLPVVQVALEAGFETHEAFSRAFHASFGCSPTQFRRRNGDPARLAAVSGVHYHHSAQVRDFRAARRVRKIMNVKIQQLKPTVVAFMRHVGPYDQVGVTWDELLTVLGKEGWLGGPAQFIGICHDDPAVTLSNKVRYDACVTVDGNFRGQGGVSTQTIPGGDYAVMTHFGPYETLGESYAKLLGQWLPRSGRSLRTTPCFEIYLNSPESAEPEDLITDIHAPLEPQ
jgi:AraC family transcriptional regulator